MGMDITIRPLLPFRLIAGDRVQASAIVHNNSTCLRRVHTSLTSDLLTVEGLITRTLILAAGERRVVDWMATAESAGGGEIVAQATVNLMENLYDQGKMDEAWHRIGSFRKESQKGVYDRTRRRWEVRMDSLIARILLDRGELDQAETIAHKNLKINQEARAAKYEGRFLELLGKIHFLQKDTDSAIRDFSESIQILKEVGNPRQLWRTHASLASVLEVLHKHGDAREQWSAAGAVIQTQASDLSDLELRRGFLEARPIRRILAKAEN
jgi:tetratricopeptide (TPR) repeat protein